MHRTGEGRKRTGWPSVFQASSTRTQATPPSRGSTQGVVGDVPSVDLGAGGTATTHLRVEGLTLFLIHHGWHRSARYDATMRADWTAEPEPDGCDLDFRTSQTPDADIDGIVLFAGIDPEDADAVSEKAEAWRRLAAEVTHAP